eukprot:16140253-Heterocapsa_arctica.AAC.1
MVLVDQACPFHLHGLVDLRDQLVDDHGRRREHQVVDVHAQKRVVLLVVEELRVANAAIVAEFLQLARQELVE